MGGAEGHQEEEERNDGDARDGVLGGEGEAEERGGEEEIESVGQSHGAHPTEERGGGEHGRRHADIGVGEKDERNGVREEKEDGDGAENADDAQLAQEGVEEKRRGPGEIEVNEFRREFARTSLQEPPERVEHLGGLRHLGVRIANDGRQRAVEDTPDLGEVVLEDVVEKRRREGAKNLSRDDEGKKNGGDDGPGRGEDGAPCRSACA